MCVIPDADLVWAMHPENHSRIRLLLYPQTQAKLIQWGNRAKIGEYFGLIHGRPPKQDNPEARNRFPLLDCREVLTAPTAIFKDLKRPLHFVHGTADVDVYVYVASPPMTFSFKHHRDFGGVLETKPLPIDSVFTTFISLHPDHVDAAVRDMQITPTCAAESGVGGTVLFWEWTDAAPGEKVPFEHEIRYGARVL